LYNETVHLHTKKLSNMNYELVTLKIPERQYVSCYEHCKRLSNQQIPFSDCKLWSVFFYKCCFFCSYDTPLPMIKSTFCSHIITKVLQEIELEEVGHLDPNSTTPSDLYDAVKESPNRVIYSSRFNIPNFKLMPMPASVV
jgi:hypothetical protein